ncbi:flagellar motor protein MotB [Cohnella pontilimi]|uniref:Flagellar motor protein MotB n=1 Tax=Cohnella pontilimi TaxID=2564100 RepID=A0A4U0F3N9_9BACL|nr:flagellar motor protein MotB [Cohnella pontilimi]TJY38940.1 flagellar motor protein MotB [Cohnella pontilimi]
MSKGKRHEPHEEHADESWLLPYSDLMTLLLALFIVLYAVSSVNTSKLTELSKAFRTAFSNGFSIFDKSTIVDTGAVQDKADERKRLNNNATKRAELRQKEQQDLEHLKQQLDKYIKQNGLTTQLETQLNRSQLLITIRDNALFPSGTAALKPESRKLAVSIGQMLQQYPDYEVLVTGHTDNEPINTAEFPSNWELSSKRAINFMKVLLENKAFDPRLFSATGYGEFRPVDTNATAAGRAKNRRVEVSILRKYTDGNSDGQASLDTSNPGVTLLDMNPSPAAGNTGQP